MGRRQLWAGGKSQYGVVLLVVGGQGSENLFDVVGVECDECKIVVFGQIGGVGVLGMVVQPLFKVWQSF